MNLTEDNNEVEFLDEGDSFEEKFLRQLILNYQNQWNHFNDQHEIKYELTVTTHKIPTPDGNKSAAYLRLTRGVRAKVEASSEELKPNWEELLVHQEIKIFKDLKEQLNPKWREVLYLNTIARLIAGGMEYAELLRKMQVLQANKVEPTEEERLNKLGLVSTSQMPAQDSEADKKYKEWLAEERAKEGV